MTDEDGGYCEREGWLMMMVVVGRVVARCRWCLRMVCLPVTMYNFLYFLEVLHQEYRFAH